DIGAHVLGREQLDVVAHRLELAPPGLRGAAGFQDEQAWRVIGDESFEAIAAQSKPLLHLVVFISHGHLNAVFCEINADSRSMHDGGLLLCWLAVEQQSAWHDDADIPTGGVHLIILSLGGGHPWPRPCEKSIPWASTGGLRASHSQDRKSTR